MGFPSLLTWVYFVLLADRPAAVQQGAYAVGKIVQFAFPLVWVLLVSRRRLQWHLPNGAGMNWGVSFGLLVAAAMVGLYYGCAASSRFYVGGGPDGSGEDPGTGPGGHPEIRRGGGFYALCHSLLGGVLLAAGPFSASCVSTCGKARAIVISSAAFMAHHVILLATYFGWTSPDVRPFLCVGIGEQPGPGSSRSDSL